MLDFAELLEHIDASVLGSDILYSKDARESLQSYLKRWQRTIDAHEEMPEDEKNSID